MAVESFYTDADLAGHGEFVEGQVALGADVGVPAGAFHAIQWRYPAVAPTGDVLARLYPAAGGAALATRPAFDLTTLDSWNVATFTSPLVVSAGTYRPTIVTPNRYPALAGFFTGGAITRGNLTMGPSYFGSGDTFPSTMSGNGSTYYVDVVFEAASEATIIDLGRISETTAMRALAAVKTATLGRITTSDSMRPLTLVKTVALGRLVETTTMRGLMVVQPTAADMDITVGPPRTAWTTGTPRTAWTVGRPR